MIKITIKIRIKVRIQIKIKIKLPLGEGNCFISRFKVQKLWLLIDARR